MSNRVTDADKININTLYLQYGTKAEVARQTGFSASTVAKYIIPNFKPIDEAPKEGKIAEKPFNWEMFNIPNWNYLLELTEAEWADMESLRKDTLL